ncbi:hypothetical protein BX600DRAFT_440115 [Xylariales sp. PMI_506]|nr:hypothetical protein BX600DRAFT_440115 [Xylariales sp. PMI_506]
MDKSIWPASSIYSDSFQLDDLLHRVSEQTWEKELRMFQALEDENKELQDELFRVQQSWESIYTMMEKVNKIAEQLNAIMMEGKSRIKKQKVNWIINCRAF